MVMGLNPGYLLKSFLPRSKSFARRFQNQEMAPAEGASVVHQVLAQCYFWFWERVVLSKLCSKYSAERGFLHLCFTMLCNMEFPGVEFSREGLQN